MGFSALPNRYLFDDIPTLLENTAPYKVGYVAVVEHPGEASSVESLTVYIVSLSGSLTTAGLKPCLAGKFWRPGADILSPC